MARKPDIQYIQFYTDGSAARQLKPQLPKKRAQQPRKRRQKRVVVQVDPVAVAGILVAAVMLVLMVVGMAQLNAAQQQAAAMSRYVEQLQEEKVRLQSEYENGYDLATIEEMALAFGMVPEGQVPHITIDVHVPQVAEAPTFWENVQSFFAGLFA